ncbi:endoglucanase II [Panaeolus papilionaceus]|nr:endoglucanase II [Panaeolus papilionaceus]
MVNLKFVFASLLSFTTLASAHYTFPALTVNGQATGDWVNVRRTNNYQSNAPVTDVNSSDFRCYTSGTTASTATVSAGSQIGFKASQGIYHAGVLNVYMAKAPSSVNGWDGSGQVWFKVHEIGPKLGGGSISWPTDNQSNFSFTIPSSLSSGEYLVRIEHIALHSASSFGGAQFYISCAQVKVTNGGSGNPGPKVAIPGVYNGRESGIMINIYYPIPTSYQQPGPAVWRG